jgi:hypothetical protein
MLIFKIPLGRFCDTRRRLGFAVTWARVGQLTCLEPLGRAANHCRPRAMTVSELVAPFLAGLVLPLVAMAVAHWLWPTF